MIFRTLIFLSFVLVAPFAAAQENSGRRPPRVAVLDFGSTEVGRRTAAVMSAHLSQLGGLRIVDAAQARAAARGIGYAGSLNLSVIEARDLGAAIDCDYFLTGDAQTIRRSSSSAPVYYEAYASFFVVNARTGRLLMWDRPRAEAPTPAEAEQTLASTIPGVPGRAYKAHRAILAAEERMISLAAEGASMTDEPPNFEDVPEEDSPAAKDFRPPAPYRRARPEYPETASEAEAEATVDVSVNIDAKGLIVNYDIVRWAGFGLDDAVAAIIKKMYFRPATRAGVNVPVRVLLRYNFRRPQPAARQQPGEGEMRLGPLFRALIKNDNAP